jgi:hypothetical protein
MARLHVRATPPSSPLLFEYGRGFPDFIDAFEHARQMPWLADVARLERAWLDAYHASEADPLPVEAVASIPAERLAGTVLTPHPATRVVRSPHSAVTIFAANRTGAPVEPIDPTRPEDGLITRPGLEVVVRRLPPGGAVFIESLVGGETLGAAAAAALSEDRGFDLPVNIEGMLESGAFTRASWRPGS